MLWTFLFNNICHVGCLVKTQATAALTSTALKEILLQRRKFPPLLQLTLYFNWAHMLCYTFHIYSHTTCIPFPKLSIRKGLQNHKQTLLSLHIYIRNTQKFECIARNIFNKLLFDQLKYSSSLIP